MWSDMVRQRHKARIARLEHEADVLVRRVVRLQDGINALTEELHMAHEELKAKVDELTAAITADQLSDQAVVTQLDAAIVALKQKIADLNIPEDFSDVLAAIDAAKSAISPVTSTTTPDAPTPSEPGETPIGG